MKKYWLGALTCSLLLISLLERPTLKVEPDWDPRIVSVGSVPSRLAGIITGHFVYSGDAAGGILATHEYSFQQMTKGKFPLWIHDVGAGQPLFPFSVYNNGILNPAHWLVTLLFNGDTNRILAFIGLFNGFLILMGVLLWFRHFNLGIESYIIGTAILFACPLLHEFPNLFTWYQPMAAALWIPYFALKFIESPNSKSAAACIATMGFFYLNTFVGIFPASLIILLAIFLSYLAIYRWNLKKSVFFITYFFIFLILSLAIASPGILPTHVFSKNSAVSQLAYLTSEISFNTGWNTLKHYGLNHVLVFTCLLLIVAHIRFRRLELSKPVLQLSIITLLCLGFTFIGFCGVLDSTALFFGANIQRINLYSPLLFFAQSLALGLGGYFIFKSPGLLTATTISLSSMLFSVVVQPLPIATHFLIVSLGLVSLLKNKTPQQSQYFLVKVLFLVTITVFISPLNQVWNRWLFAFPTDYFTAQSNLALAAPYLVLILTGLIFYRHYPKYIWSFFRGNNSTHTHQHVGAFPLLLMFVLLDVPISLNNNIVGSSTSEVTLDSPIQQTLTANSPNFRSVATFFKDKENRRLPERVTYENADAALVWINFANLFHYMDPSGGMSLTPKRHSEFLNFSNYGMFYEHENHPLSAYYNAVSNTETVPNGIPVYRAYQYMSRNGGYIWWPNAAMWRYLGIRHVYTTSQIDLQGFELIETINNPHSHGRNLIKRVRHPQAYLYELTETYPLIYSPSSIHFTNSFTEATLEEMRDAPTTQKFAVIIDSRRRNGEKMISATAAEIRDIHFGVNRVSFKVGSRDGNYIVISQNQFPGWEAEIDGSPIPLYEANYAFSAVEVPPGSHLVELVFRNKTLKKSLILSLLGILFSIVFILGIGRYRSIFSNHI
jgi:hypothetical protein